MFKRSLLLAGVLCLMASFYQRKIRWVAVGDSITYLNDHQDETANRITKGYMTRVTERLTDIEYINQGHNGWTAVNIAKEIENLGVQKADVYSVFLGTNDWWAGLPLGTIDDYINNTGTRTYFGAYRIIINKLRGLNAKARIILVTPMQRVDFVYINDMKNNAYGSYRSKNGQNLSQFADAVKAIGIRENFAVIDLYNDSRMKLKALVKYKRLKDPATGKYKEYSYPSFVNIPFDPEKDDYPYPPEAANITYDGLHPSDKGYQIIAELFVDLLKGFQPAAD